MRFYTFGNYYLSSLQQGLQGTHVLGELIVKYKEKSDEYKTIKDWAKNHKVMVMLNGGNQLTLDVLHTKLTSLKKKGMKLPFAKFNEDEQSLGSALTCVGIIVPEKFYAFSPQMRKLKNEDEAVNLAIENGFINWEIQLMLEMNKYDLAK